MKQKEALRSIFSGIVASAFFLVLFLCFHWNIFLCAVLALGIFAAVFLISKPERRIGKIKIEGMENAEEVERKLQEAREDFESIRISMKQIEDQNLREQSGQLHQKAGDILHYLEKHPEKILMARRFIDYYQDTASSLLKRYVELQESNLETAEVQRLKESTGKAITILNDAFDQQFQRLMSNEMLDMDAEIKLIEQTMKGEGLS